VAITRSIQQAVLDVGGQRPSDEQAAYVIGMALGPALAHAAPDVPREKHAELSNRYRYHYLKLQAQVTCLPGLSHCFMSCVAVGIIWPWPRAKAAWG